MKRTKTQIGAILFAFVMAVSLVAPAGAAMVDSQVQNQEVTFTDDTATITDDVKQAQGPTEIMVRLDDPSSAQIKANGVDALKANAEATQKDVLAFAEQNENVEVLNTFWITSAVLVEVNTDKVDLKKLASIQHVEELHSNFEVNAPETPTTKAPVNTDSQPDTTYGLDMIDAPEVWEQFDKGGNAKVAVLDTGVDASHQDIDLYRDGPTGGFAYIESDGTPNEDKEATDSGKHGTHTTGTVAGGDASGEHVGVAPNAKVIHGLVLDGGSGSAATIIGGMEWAVNNDADVISMSLGSSGYTSAFIEPVQNAHDAGSIVIAATGNSGVDSSGSPGNIVDSVGVGAVDSNRDVTGFSSGEVINTQSAWGSDAPDYWPEEYITPKVSAPGKAVKSTVPGDSYEKLKGTSMATPHVAGVATLMVSAAGGDLSVDKIEQALIDSTFKPDDEPDEQDKRYGHGIVNALDAVQNVALDSGVKGTVTSEGEPVEGATVSIGDRTATTSADGSYELMAEAGTYDMSVSGQGIETTTESVTIEEGSFTQKDVSAAPALGVELLDGQADAVQKGDAVSLEVKAQNLESLTIETAGDYGASNADLMVNGESASFGQALDFNDVSGTVSITVETSADATGDLKLEHTIAGAGDETTVTTGPTDVVDELIDVGLVGSSYTDSLQSALEGQLSGVYEFGSVSSASEAGDYDVVVVQTLADMDAGSFVDATSGSDTGVIYLDQWGDEANAIPQFAGVSDAVSNTEETDSYDGDAEGAIAYEASADHPILEGVVASGEKATIHEGQYSDVTWFETSSFDVLASAADSSQSFGAGLAIDEDSKTVLASSLGYTQYVGSEQYTDNADAILGNAVAYLADTDEDEPEPEPEPSLALDSVDAPSSGNTGESVTVEATVSNSGDAEGETTVTFTFGGQELGSQTVSVAAGATETVSFSATLPSEAGSYDWTLEAAGESVSDTLEVSEPPEDGLSVKLSPNEATVGLSQTTTFDLVIEGASNGVGAYDLKLSVDDSAVAEFVNVSLQNDPEFPNVENNGDSLVLEVGQGSNVFEGGDVTVAEVTVNATAEGSTGISMSDVGVIDENNNGYAIADTSGAQLTAEETELPPVVGDRTPQDLDNDGLYEDVNGDGEFNIFDVQALFSNLNNDAVQDYPEAYNFDESENPQEVNIFDVQALFTLMQSQMQSASA